MQGSDAKTAFGLFTYQCFREQPPAGREVDLSDGRSRAHTKRSTQPAPAPGAGGATLTTPPPDLRLVPSDQPRLESYDLGWTSEPRPSGMITGVQNGQAKHVGLSSWSQLAETDERIIQNPAFLRRSAPQKGWGWSKEAEAYGMDRRGANLHVTPIRFALP